MLQLDSFGRTLSSTGATALAGGGRNLGCTQDAPRSYLGEVHPGHVVGTDAHASQTAGALFLIHHSHHPAYLEHIFGKDSRGPGGSGISLGNSLVKELGIVSCPTEENALCWKVHWTQLDVGLQEEPLQGTGKLEELGQLSAALGWHHRFG